jgi:hypothetical protein
MLRCRRWQQFLSVAAALLIAACGARDPMADVRQEYPGAEEYRAWKKYVLVRYAQDDDARTREAVLLKRRDDGLKELARSTEGFVRGREVMTYIPELDESGVAAFDLH